MIIMKLTGDKQLKGVLAIIIFAFNYTLHVTCIQVSLYECPCSEESEKCENNSVNRNSSIWNYFVYPTMSPDVTVNATVRLLQKTSGVSCHPENLSENILINFLDSSNQFDMGYDGQLHGVLQRTEEVVELQISEKGVLTLYTERGLEQFNMESFCIRRFNESHSYIQICCGRFQKSCIRKCCPHGYTFTNNFTNPCIIPNKTSFHEMETTGWSLPMMMPWSSSSSSKLSTRGPLKIRTGFPNCQEGIHNITVVLSSALTKFQLPRQPFRLYYDGTVQYLGIGSEPRSSGLRWNNKLDDVDYCVDTLAIPQDKMDLTCGPEEQDVLILCKKPVVTEFTKNDWVWIYRIVYMVGFTISIFFLLLTAIVHFLLWEKQNIHAWTILCYVISLTGFYSCLLAIYVDETRKRMYPDHFTPFISEGWWCYVLGLVTHFMGVFAFSWLSVINFDLWWTFRVLKPMNQRVFDFKRLLSYAIFACAVPTTVVSVAIALQLTSEKRNESCRQTKEDHTIYPLYGQEGCFLANSSQPYYFYLPVGVLLLANLIFYLCTSCQMLRIYNATRRLASDRSSSKKQQQSCELFFKLFLVMGATWIFQVILAFIETDDAPSAWYFIVYVILDLSNMFQAIAIFVIFVCKRETLRALEQKYTCFKSCLHPFRGMYEIQPTHHSRSTDGGSTKMSRTSFTFSKHNSIDSCGSSNGIGVGGSDHRTDSELMIFSTK